MSLLDLGQSRLGSGTSWLPDSSAQHMIDTRFGKWDVMFHGSAFGMYDKQWTLHGDSRFGLLDWEMARASRRVGAGLVRLSAMTSFESFFLPDTGYPELLQSGETFGGRRIANTQHPHDLFGELAVGYDYSVNSKLVISTCAAAVGEPALGPVSYMHRPSGGADPFAPLGLHWQDQAHQQHGVATLGIYSSAFRLEGSAFNAREGDDVRTNLDYRGARLDSYSGRVTVVPSGTVTLAAWAGYLSDHDPLVPGIGMQRYGASVLTSTHRLSTSIVWGMNDHHHDPRTHEHDPNAPVKTHHLMSSVLLESTFAVDARTEIFARAEQVEKSADDLGFLGGDLTEMFNIRAVSVGASRAIVNGRGAALSIGARLGYNFLPQTLRYTYTTTHPAGFAIYLRLLPAKHELM